MRRILKLKSTQCYLFDHENKAFQHREELKEIRDICSADFKNINDNLREFPSSASMLKQRKLSSRQIQGEENIMATSALMFGEVTERIRALLAGMINECLELQGPPPCKFALIGNQQLGRKDLSPFEPVSVFLVIEKDTASTKAYFRSTIALLGMKILNLGETTIPALNIRSLHWLNENAKPSGFSLLGYIDDTEKKDFSTIPLDCLRTPKDLLQLAVTNKPEVRAGIVSLLQDITFITGKSRRDDYSLSSNDSVNVHVRQPASLYDYKSDVEENLDWDG